MASARFPVSIKGILFLGDRVVLLKNEREEWELPGGKLEPGEDPPLCLAREIEEELGICAEVGALVDCWLYDVLGKVEVLIVTYGCIAPATIGENSLVLSHEHKALACFSVDEIDGLPMPEAYRRSIRAWDRRRKSR